MLLAALSAQQQKKASFFNLETPDNLPTIQNIPSNKSTNGPGLLLWITNRDSGHRSVFQPSVDPSGPPQNNDAIIVINLSEFRHMSYRYLYWPLQHTCWVQNETQQDV